MSTKVLGGGLSRAPRDCWNRPGRGRLAATDLDRQATHCRRDRKHKAGMDSVYLHPTSEMRQRLCDVLEQLWRTAVAQCYELAPRSAVPLLDQALIACERGWARASAPQSAPQDE